MRRKPFIVLFGAITLALAVGGIAIGGTPFAGPDQVPTWVGENAVPVQHQQELSLDAARSFAQRPLYYAGDEVAGYPLTRIVREYASPGRDPLTHTYLDRVMFIYGACDSSGEDATCTPPAQVHVWRLCDRNPGAEALVSGDPKAVPGVVTTVRGVPARVTDMGEEGSRIELWTGESTIVVWGETSAISEAVAAALAPLNQAAIQLGTELPLPADGALDNKLTCAEPSP